MKTRVTFRVAPDIAESLRGLANQTRFVEDALRDALGKTCPACGGTGRLPLRQLAVSNVKSSGLPPLNGTQARQLKRVVRLGQEVGATSIGLKQRGQEVGFSLRREQHELLTGTLSESN